MNNKFKNGDTPASPTQYMDQAGGSGELYCDQAGLTKREHFAGLAMQGLCAADSCGAWFNPKTAKAAVKMADALLKELGR